jgi:tape measure domain-containing protein
MAVKIGDLFFEVSADTNSARNSISGLGGAGVQAANLIGGALSSALDAAAFAAKTAAAIITTELIGAGAAFNVAGQQATALFTALTGSADEALGLLREFGELSLEQPIFDIEGLQRTTSLLLTFRVAKDDALELAENINLAAIALGRGQAGATQLARAIGQIQGRGFLEGDEARQLSEVGVNAYAVIGDAIGKTTAEVQELGRQNLLLADVVLPILNDYLEQTFGPVAQTALKTYGVQAQGLRNVLTGIGSALVEPFIGRSGGGVIVDFLTDVREELLGVVSVAEDGSFELTGALAPLTEVVEALAEGFSVLGDSFVDGLSGLGDSGALDSFASGLASAIPGIVSGIQSLVSGVIDFGQAVNNAISDDFLDGVLTSFGLLFDFGSKALPIIADGFVSLVAIVTELSGTFQPLTNAIIAFASPVILDLLTAIADALGLIADNTGLILSAASVWVAWKGALLIAEVATASFVSVTLSALSAQLLTIAAQAGLALAAFGALTATNSAFNEGPSWLNEDVPFYEAPFQAAGRASFALFGGDRGAVEEIDNFEAARAAANDFNLSLLDNAETFADARAQALEYANGLGIAEDNAADFANIVALAWNDAAEAQERASRGSAINVPDVFEERIPGLQEFIDNLTLAEEGLRRVYLESVGFVDIPAVEDAADAIKLFEDAADRAWEALDRLLTADAGATVDDFLRGLAGAGEDLTDALNIGGVLGDLEVSGVLGDVTSQARDVIRTLVEDYGLSLDEIETLFRERGFTAVIEEITKLNKGAADSVDPLIAAYGDLGVELDVVKDAVGRLQERRDNELEKQIDVVTAALEEAKAAAEDAKKAFDDYFLGGTGGLQGAIDDLVLDIPSIGSNIEDALRTGGVQGEAGIRQALSGLGSSLGNIFELGLKEGLSPQQIIDRLGPVYGSIQQDLSGALNRISSLDWSEGFTPAAAAEIEAWLAGILDPSQISGVFNNLARTEGAISGLEAQLDALQAEKRIDVVFSKEQVQAEIDAIQVEVPVDPVVSEEAGKALYDAIQTELERDDLRVAIDDGLLTQQILDAAREAQNQIDLELDSRLIFDKNVLLATADFIGGQFGGAFREAIVKIFNQPATLGEAIFGPTPAVPPMIAAPTSSNVAINNNIVIQGTSSPRTTASEVIAASSAAAGSGGRYDPSKYNNNYVPRLGQNTPV